VFIEVLNVTDFFIFFNERILLESPEYAIIYFSTPHEKEWSAMLMPSFLPIRTLAWIIAGGLLFGSFLLGFFSLNHNSVTIDEYAHLPAGYYYYQTGNFYLFPKNPPLVKLLMAAPLLLLKPDISTDARLEQTGWYPWQFGQDFMERNRERYQQIFFSGRIPVLALMLLTGVFIFLWASEAYGPWGGLSALLLFAFEPNVLAHSGLASVDIGCACGFIAAIYFYKHQLAQPSLRRALFAGLALGCAELTKYTAILLYPILGLLTLIFWLKMKRKTVERSLLPFMSLALVVLVSIIIINIGYGFQDTRLPLGHLPLQSHFMQGLAQYLPSNLKIPLPGPYLHGFDVLRLDTEIGEFPNYLLGQWSKSGWNYYFPLTMLLKMPLILLALILLAPLCRFLPIRPYCLANRQRFRGYRWEYLITIPALVLLFLFSFLIHTNYGIRYLLPLFPFLFVYVGRWAPYLAQSSRKIQKIFILLLLIYPASALLAHPHYLSYFNLFGRDDRSKHQLLLDSNLDWGQDLPDLKAFMVSNGLERIGLAYFGHVDPAIYGIDWDIPESGISPYVAVSANYAHGYPYPIYRHGGMRNFPEGSYDWAANKTPLTTINGSILIFRFDKDMVELGAARLYEKAFELHQAKQFVAAKSAYERALWANDRIPLIHYNYALVLCELGYTDQAIEEFQRIPTLDPSNQNGLNPESEERLAFCFHKVGRFEEAINAYRNCLQFKPNDPLLLRNIAIAEEQRGHYAGAINTLTFWARIESENWLPHYEAAKIYQKLKMIDYAREALANAQRLAPDNAQVILLQEKLDEAQKAATPADSIPAGAP
jgi:tetratricopeptide (TPR) repeat protein